MRNFQKWLRNLGCGYAARYVLRRAYRGLKNSQMNDRSSIVKEPNP
jgi:hypothetical protein